MKRRLLFSIAVFGLLSGVAFAGYEQPVPVEVDLVNMDALGDQLTARTSDNDVEFIGCGFRLTDDGVNPPYSWGFCQAGDSEENQITCFTVNANLLDTLKASSAFAFITFSWQDDGFGGAECTRIGFSTQSFYLDAKKKKAKKK